MKTKPKSKCLTRVLAALAATVMCGTARADLTLTNSANTATWNNELGAAPFYTTSISTATTGQAPVAPSAGATNVCQSEIFTITNGAGGLGAVSGATNYVLTGIGVLQGSGTAATVKVHLYDVTALLSPSNGTTLNGSGTSYSITTTGDLLGGGAGLVFSDASLSAATQVNAYLSSGTNTADQVILQTNHTYALEFSSPAGQPIWYRGSTADPGGQGMGSGNAVSGARTTLAALGQAGGAPRTFAIALYGYATSFPGTVNTNTNTAGQINYVVDDFSPNGVANTNPTNDDFYNLGPTNLYSAGGMTNVWGNWFGDASTSCTWDGTHDAQNNPNSGSMLVGMNFSGSSQLIAWDNGAAFFDPNINGLQYPTFECDVLFSNGSAQVTNPADGVVSYGYLQFGARTSTFGQDYFGNGVEIPVGTTHWTHIKIPLNPIGDANQTTIVGALFVHIYGPQFGPTATLVGNSQFWVDNIKFSGSGTPAVIPPPTLSIQPAVPGLRIFAGSVATIYDREELNTLNSNESWVAASAGNPVSYSFTLLSNAKAAGFQTSIFLLPVASAVNSFVNNQYIDYQDSNDLWLAVASRGDGSVTAQVAWKTNTPNANPNNVALMITNSTGVGTWTLKFTSATAGTLTAPGAAPAPFTIADSSAMTDFANPLVAFFGLQANGTAGGGQWNDYANITVSGTAGGPINDTFANDVGIDTTNTWNINNSVAQTSLVQVPIGSPFWVNWTLPATGFVLTTAPVTSNSPGAPNAPSPFTLPGYYTDDLLGTQPPNQAQQGGAVWTLMNTNFMPTTNWVMFAPPTSIGFFQLANPAPAN